MVTTAQPAILLIDDDELVAGSLRDYLLARGSAVDVAADADAAARVMTARRYDAVVVDPYFTGSDRPGNLSLFETIRLLQPGAALIILTGYDSPALLQAASASEASAILTKPQSVTALEHLIGTAVRTRHVLEGSS